MASNRYTHTLIDSVAGSGTNRILDVVGSELGDAAQPLVKVVLSTPHTHLVLAISAHHFKSIGPVSEVCELGVLGISCLASRWQCLFDIW